MWWVYFLHDTGGALEERRELSFLWGYSHYFVFAAAAAVGGALEAGGDRLLVTAAAVEEHLPAESSGRTVAVAVAIAASAFLLVTVFVHSQLTDGHLPALPETAVAAAAMIVLGYVVGDASMPVAVLLEGLVVACLAMSAVLRDTVPEEIA
jgi:uncharacterized membrane protein YfcA